MTDLPICVVDLETRSALNLGRGGTNAYVYAAHPTTDVWLGRYAYDDDPDTVLGWRMGDPMPADLRAHVEAGGIICAHNAGFEHAVWTHVLAARYGWCALPLAQLDDTAARAARCGLPRKLELTAKSLGLEQQKDMKGAAQMKRMAKPRKTIPVDDESPAGMSLLNDPRYDDPAQSTYHGGVLYEWWALPDRVERLDDYCEQDVRTQMAIHLTLPRLPAREWEVWQATMRANVRGCRLDIPFIRKAMAMVDEKLAAYAEELLTLTDGQVTSHTDLHGMKRWLKRQGHEVESLDKNVVAAMVADKSLPDAVRRMAQIRAEAGKSSVAKYPAMLAHADEHDIAPDQLVYYGATSTGRWSGQGIQLQNLPARGGVGHADAEGLIDICLQANSSQAIEFMETAVDGSAVETLSMCLRGAIRAREGFDIVCADYSNIEGRFAAWLAGEEWKLDAFRAFDAGTGPDLYKVAAGGILGQDPREVIKTMRNAVGKVSELALQFQGGVGAFLSMAAVYRVEIADYWPDIQRNLSAQIIEEAKEAWGNFGKGSGTDKITWLAAESVKRAWRERHPRIVQSWYDIEEAALYALQLPGAVASACDGKLKFLGSAIGGKPVLLIRLPNGRCVHYFNAQVRSRRTPWGTEKPQIVFDKVEGGRVLRSATYGGDCFQTAVQGGARDVMADGWLRAEQRGYLPLFSVHDELACEYPEGRVVLADFEATLCELESWAEGLPVSAGGYVAKRFRKD